jgi:hypothetical protein
MQGILKELRTTKRFFVAGKVISVQDDGLLVRTYDEGPREVVFLKGHPSKDELFDGSLVMSCAILSGRFQYPSTGGALKTVPLYEYGKPINPKNLTPAATIETVTTDGESTVTGRLKRATLSSDENSKVRTDH